MKKVKLQQYATGNALGKHGMAIVDKNTPEESLGSLPGKQGLGHRDRVLV
jgi:hypothetical protein